LLKYLRKRGIKETAFLVGTLHTGLPITEKLVNDVEKLLIFHVSPPGNDTGKNS
jgi:hypothetical protein